MIRLIAAGLALLGLAAACGGNTEEAAPPATTAPYTGAADAPAAKPFPPPCTAAPKQTKVLVTVVDGDTHRRVRGARVVIGKRADYANTRGLASVKIKRRTALPVRVSKPGYGAEGRAHALQAQAPGDRAPLPATALQWTMYGANDRRTQAPPDIKVRPPFKVVWSRGVGSLVEFPAVVADGVAYVGNYKGHIYALNMRNGAVLWRYRPEPREDGVLARDRRRRPGRARDGRDRARARPEQRPPALALPRRLADRVVADRLRRARLLRRLERPRLRARPEAAEAALELPHGLQDHVERGDRGADALHRRLRRPPARARRRARASAASSARSTAASTGRRRSRRAASSSPRRPATA